MSDDARWAFIHQPEGPGPLLALDLENEEASPMELGSFEVGEVDEVATAFEQAGPSRWFAERCFQNEGPLSTEQRDALPEWSFGIPDRRAYPMPDVTHARVASARASQQEDALDVQDFEAIKGKARGMERSCALTPAERERIDRLYLGRRQQGPGMPWWGWLLGGLAVAGAGVGITLLVVRARGPAEEEPTETPNGNGSGNGNGDPLPEPPVWEGEEAPTEPGIIVRHGARANTAGRAITFANLNAWVTWAADQLVNENLEVRTGEQIGRGLWGNTFPEAFAASSPDSWTIAGVPFSTTASRAQEVIDTIQTMAIPSGWSPLTQLARAYTGQTFTPWTLKIPQPPGSFFLYRNGYFGLQAPRKIQHPAAGQGQWVNEWWVWAPGTTDLSPVTAKAKGTTSKKADAIKAISNTIEELQSNGLVIQVA